MCVRVLHLHVYLSCSEHDSTLGVLLLTEDNGSASLDASEIFGLGLRALELQHNLFGLLCLLSEHWLGLSSETLLFHIVTSLSLSGERGLTSLVLRDFLGCVAAGLSAVRSNSLWNVDHFAFSSLSN